MEPEIESSSPPRISLWLLGLLGTSLALLSLRRSPAQSGNDATESVHPQKTPADKCKQVNSAVLANVPPTPPKYHPPYRSKDDTPGWKKRVEIIVAGSTAGLLFINVGLLLINISLNKSTKKAAKVADNTLHFYKEQMRLDQRAWLQIEPGAPIIKSEGPDASAHAVVYIKNTGKTPATYLEGWTKVQLLRIVVSGEKPDFIHRNADTPISVPLLSSNTSSKAIVWAGPPRDRSLDVVISGQINYCDVFREQHQITFCLQWWPNPNFPEGGQYLACSSVSPEYNSIDDVAVHQACSH